MNNPVLIRSILIAIIVVIAMLRFASKSENPQTFKEPPPVTPNAVAPPPRPEPVQPTTPLLREPSLPELMTRFLEGTDEERKTAGHLLQARGAEAVLLLTTCLTDNRYSVRRDAAALVDAIRGEKEPVHVRAKRILDGWEKGLRNLTSEDVPLLIAAVDEHDLEFNIFNIHAEYYSSRLLGEKSAKNAQLERENAERKRVELALDVVGRALQALAVLKAKESAPAVSDLFTHCTRVSGESPAPGEELRSRAVSALAAFEQEGIEHLCGLARFVNHKCDFSTRDEVVLKQIVDQLAAARPVREIAVVTLGQMAEPSGRIGYKALRAIQKLGPEARAAVPSLIRSLPDATVRTGYFIIEVPNTRTTMRVKRRDVALEVLLTIDREHLVEDLTAALDRSTLPAERKGVEWALQQLKKFEWASQQLEKAAAALRWLKLR